MTERTRRLSQTSGVLLGLCYLSFFVYMALALPVRGPVSEFVRLAGKLFSD